MFWTARTESRKDAGSVNIGNIGATEDAARRRFAAVATLTVFDTVPVAAARLAIHVDQSSNPARDRPPRRRRTGAPRPAASPSRPRREPLPGMAAGGGGDPDDGRP